MKYFFLFPSRPQYFFPFNYSECQFFLRFFTPYTFKGSLIWWLWKKSYFLKYFFQVNESEVPDLASIKNYIGNKGIWAINKGTPGPEQKTTAIGYLPDRDQRLFIKYAESEKARELIINEHFILQKLIDIEGVPQIIEYKNNCSAVMLQTRYVDGEKLRQTILTDQIIDLLLKLVKVNATDCRDYTRGFAGIKCFGHGDFCPWNILIEGNDLHLVDWEMAGIYPVGYDLFNYIFQTQFLLHPSKQPKKILGENTKGINSYFAGVGISDWLSLLWKFAELKSDFNKVKNPKLAGKFNEILRIKSLNDR